MADRSRAFETYQRGTEGVPQPGLLGAEAFGRPAPDQYVHIGEGSSFQDYARFHVFEYVKNRLDKSEDRHKTFAPDEVFVVWSCKTLQNWKALVSTTLPDGMYYEVTYNGDKRETYLDVYKKFENVCIPDEE